MTRGRCGSLLLHRDGLAPSTPCRSPGALCFTPDCVAKLFAALRESNNRIRLNDVLNLCCALAFVLESILLILIVKIVLQHNPPESRHSLRQLECPLCANRDRCTAANSVAIRSPCRRGRARSEAR